MTAIRITECEYILEKRKEWQKPDQLKCKVGTFSTSLVRVLINEFVFALTAIIRDEKKTRIWPLLQEVHYTSAKASVS